MSKLTRAERDAIIMNESRGILHPEYYCCKTKNGSIQVRKRKVPLNTNTSDRMEHPRGPWSDQKILENTSVRSSIPKVDESKVEKSAEPNYESVTNKQLLEKMLTILEKNVVNRDENLNDPEREKVTEENRKFVENIKERVENPKERSSEDIPQQMKEEPKNEVPVVKPKRIIRQRYRKLL